MKQKQFKTYVVLWEDENTDLHQEYVQATSATEGVRFLGVPEKQVVQIAVVLKNWKGSK